MADSGHQAMFEGLKHVALCHNVYWTAPRRPVFQFCLTFSLETRSAAKLGRHGISNPSSDSACRADSWVKLRDIYASVGSPARAKSSWPKLRLSGLYDFQQHRWHELVHSQASLQLASLVDFPVLSLGAWPSRPCRGR